MLRMKKKVLKIELKSGNQKIYEINQLAMNSICVNDKKYLYLQYVKR